MKTITSREKSSPRTDKRSRRATVHHNGNGNGHPTPSASRGASREVTAWLARPKRNLIDGRWVAARSGKEFDVLNPADASLLTRVPDSTGEDIAQAVQAARRAFEGGPWRRLTPSERGKLLWRVGELLLKHADEFAELESLDNGKPRAVARVADVPLAADLFQYMAGWATKIEGNTIPISVPYAPGARFHAFTLREPVGVVGQIIPWNFPLLMAAWKLGPALATGNCVVLKPAEQTPLSALRLGELLLEAGLPAGVVNIVTGFGETAGAPLVADPGVDKIAFTGSTEVGRLIVRAAAGNLKKVSLELGGKSPNILFQDAGDLEAAIKGAANAIFFNHGQCCCAGSRLMVEQGIFDDVVEGVAREAKKIKLGPGLSDDTQMGPLAHARRPEYMDALVRDAVAQGARLLAGGRRIGNQGFFFEPTVLSDVPLSARLMQEEPFGPIAVINRFHGFDEAVAEANRLPFGLAAFAFTGSPSTMLAVTDALEAGMVAVNSFNIATAEMPFGGVKESGHGAENGIEGVEACLVTKMVSLA